MPKPGYLTASSFDKLMSGFKDESPSVFSKTAAAVVNRLAIELAGYREDWFEEDSPGGARGWGNEYEWLARETYSERKFYTVRQAEFTVADDSPYVGGTIDGLVGADGGLEIKCPYNPINHIDRDQHYLTYKYQIHGYMWIFGLNWVDFVSYDPRFPEKLQLFIDHIERDDGIIRALKTRCQAAYIAAGDKAAELLKKP